MRQRSPAQPLDDDPTIIWSPSKKGPVPVEAAGAEEVLRTLPSVLTYAPITQAAMPLLAAIIAFRRITVISDIDALRHNMIAAVKRFEQTAAVGQTHADDVVAARYLLCCALDEVIATTSSIGGADWSKNSLLVSFHNESWGGDKAFVLIERLRQDPKRYQDLLQLSLFILALGFEGRYRVINNGLLQLEELRAEITRQIEVPHEDGRGRALLAQQPILAKQKRSIYLPMWVSLTVAGCLLFVMLFYIGADVKYRATPTVDLIGRVQQMSVAPQSPGDAGGPNANDTSGLPAITP